MIRLGVVVYLLPKLLNFGAVSIGALLQRQDYTTHKRGKPCAITKDFMKKAKHLIFYTFHVSSI